MAETGRANGRTGYTAGKEEKMQSETTDLDDQANRSDRKAPAKVSRETRHQNRKRYGPKNSGLQWNVRRS